MFSYFSYGEKNSAQCLPIKTQLSNTETISHSVHVEFFTLESGFQRGEVRNSLDA